jgi:predicted RNase H-like nuclease (RuvC/YqgF family)
MTAEEIEKEAERRDITHDPFEVQKSKEKIRMLADNHLNVKRNVNQLKKELEKNEKLLLQMEDEQARAETTFEVGKGHHKCIAMLSEAFLLSKGDTSLNFLSQQDEFLSFVSELTRSKVWFFKLYSPT